MIFDRNENKEVIALLGAGSMGCAIVRRVAAGRKILFGDISEAALDPVALDRASLDQIYLSDDPGRDAMIFRIESHDGAHLLDYAESLGLGSQAYELIPA